MRRISLWLIAALTLVSAGCTVHVNAPEVTSAPQPAHGGHPAPGDAELAAPPPRAETAAQSSQPSAAPEVAPQVKLVPIDPKWELGFQMLVPEGWHTNVTALKDNVQISKDGVMIMVSTRQLRGQPAPMNEKEMIQSIADWAPPDTTVKQIQKPGTLSAFELRYTVQGDVPTPSLNVWFFGRTYYQWVSLKAPTGEFEKWEPMFREIIASFKPPDLNGMPLPGRP